MNSIRSKTLRDIPAIRWLVLFLVSFLMFATYYFQDFYSGLKDLVETDFGFTSEEFGRMIGLTTIANVFGMIIVGGIILDKWGIRLAGLVFGSLAALGGLVSAITAAGYFGYEKSTLLTGLIIGRIMFGIGLEVICVVVLRAVVKWFKGYELALAMALNMGFGRLGSALAIAISLDLAGTSVSPAVTFAAVLIGLSMIMFIIYLFFDIKIDKQLKILETEGEKQSEEEFRLSDLIKLVTNKSFVFITLLCVAFYSAVFPFIQYAPDLLVNKFNFTYLLPEGASIKFLGSEAFGNALVYIIIFIFALGITVVPNNMKKASQQTITRLSIFLLFIIAVYLKRDILSVWFFNGPKTAALIPLGTIIFTPVFGSFIDKKGKAASLMIAGSFLLIFAHLSISLSNSIFMAYLGLLSLGVAFSLVPAAMWPSVAKIVAENRLGTAYATMFTVQNWGLLLFYWGIGALLDFANKENLEAIRAGDMSYNYFVPILTLALCGLISVFLAIKLKQVDRKEGYGLELPSNS